jgi:metal-responsive CopG/Arc/MetJ family transcriptional regulator
VDVRRFTKVTISLPTVLLEDVERSKETNQESRSETIARLLQAALRAEQEQSDVERYIKGYLEQPDTEEEIAIAEAMSTEAAALDPWP